MCGGMEYKDEILGAINTILPGFQQIYNEWVKYLKGQKRPPDGVVGSHPAPKKNK
jgi:hypothetical protein